MQVQYLMQKLKIQTTKCKLPCSPPSDNTLKSKVTHSDPEKSFLIISISLNAFKLLSFLSECCLADETERQKSCTLEKD